MKKIISFVATSVFVLCATIMITSVHNANASGVVKLKCSSSYKLNVQMNRTTIAGPNGEALVVDVQKDPEGGLVSGEAKVTLFTYAGKFVATYSESGSYINTILVTDGHTNEITVAQSIGADSKYSVEIQSPLKGDVDRVVFTCELTN